MTEKESNDAQQKEAAVGVAVTQLQVFANDAKQLGTVQNCAEVQQYFAPSSRNVLICVKTEGEEVILPESNSTYRVTENDKPFFQKEAEKTQEIKHDPGKTGVLCEACQHARVLLLFTGEPQESPINIKMLSLWKKWLVEEGKAFEIKIDFWREGKFDDDYLRGRIFRHCAGWLAPDPQSRPVTLEVRGLVTMDSQKDVSIPMTDGLTAVMFGATQDVITRLERVRQRFVDQLRDMKNKETVKVKIKEKEAVKVKEKEVIKEVTKDCDYYTYVCKKLKDEVVEDNGIKDIEYWRRKVRVALPKLLLRGESGVGKTFAARLMDDFKVEGTTNTDGTAKEENTLTRISIPEFIGKESEFEYALFGYTPGSYTGASPEGSPGLLVKNVGRVVYLDEIGEANATIQAKLLAYLDDYMVRPRGWLDAPFFAPTFIVAGTNRDLEQMAEVGTFRKDLLARFTDIETIPPLRERRESMDFILDCLLQQPDINPDEYIKGITQPAHNRLKYYDYAKGNFRELEDILRTACWRARNSGRRARQEGTASKNIRARYIYECDLEGLM